MRFVLSSGGIMARMAETLPFRPAGPVSARFRAPLVAADAATGAGDALLVYIAPLLSHADERIVVDEPQARALAE